VTRWFERLVSSIAGPDHVVGPAVPVIGPRPAQTVAPPPRFAWDEKRWRHKETGGRTEVSGPYRVFDRRQRAWREFAGHLISESGRVSAYIADPPAEMKGHRHGPCLQFVQHPWFRLHWSTEPRSLDDALLYMERMLDESINGTRR
jgi:hypothetical protein